MGGITVDRKKLPAYERKDLGHGVPAEQRPSDADYDRYVFLVDLFRKASYDERQIYGECPFLVDDSHFTTDTDDVPRNLRVIGVSAGRTARAFSIAKLRRHEIANTHLGSEPVAGAY